jgi:hypothetical protein
MADLTQITELRLEGMGIPPYSARGLAQTLAPIAGSTQMRRTVNGALRDVADPLFRKYQSTITGGDMDPPALEGIWPGMVLTVDCIPELSFEGEPSTGGFTREAVPGSTREANGFTFYRPRLIMLVTGFNVNRDEWEATLSWSLALEEV